MTRIMSCLAISFMEELLWARLATILIDEIIAGYYISAKVQVRRIDSKL